MDNELSFKAHMEDLCKKASRKMHGLVRIMPDMDFLRKHTLFDAFFKS